MLKIFHLPDEGYQFQYFLSMTMLCCLDKERQTKTIQLQISNSNYESSNRIVFSNSQIISIHSWILPVGPAFLPEFYVYIYSQHKFPTTRIPFDSVPGTGNHHILHLSDSFILLRECFVLHSSAINPDKRCFSEITNILIPSNTAFMSGWALVKLIHIR